MSLQEQILKTLRDDDAKIRTEATKKRRGSTAPDTGQPIRKETVTAKLKRAELSALEKAKSGNPGAPSQGEVIYTISFCSSLCS
jgi:hypothetical protein